MAETKWTPEQLEAMREAAPELYEALAAMVSAFERGCQNVRPENKQMAKKAMRVGIKQARAALSRTRGEQSGR